MSVASTENKLITLKAESSKGLPIEAVYSPERGMNLVSFKWGSIELIDQGTRSLFEQRNAGLGALIGPHFHHRNPAVIPEVDRSLFPHLAAIKPGEEPFSHGIARYVGWKAESDGKKIRAELKGKDEWKGVPVAQLEGQDFTMVYEASVDSEGLHIALSVCSETDSVVGLHHYYALPNAGEVRSDVRARYFDGDETKELPNLWQGKSRHQLHFALPQVADFGFQPHRDSVRGDIVLDVGDYALSTRYRTTSAENRWQLYHPEGASFVCIEPMTAENPRKPQLSVSSLEVHLSL